MPATVPAVALGVLGVGLQGAGAERGEGPQAVVGGNVDGALPDAVSCEEALADQPAEARAHLLGRPAARLGDGEDIGGGDRAVVAGDAEDEHARRQVAVADRVRRGAGAGRGTDAAARTVAVVDGGDTGGGARIGRVVTGRLPHDRQ